MRRRAEKLHGSLVMETPETGGTLLIWEVPIRATSSSPASSLATLRPVAYDHSRWGRATSAEDSESITV